MSLEIFRAYKIWIGVRLRRSNSLITVTSRSSKELLTSKKHSLQQIIIFEKVLKKVANAQKGVRFEYPRARDEDADCVEHFAGLWGDDGGYEELAQEAADVEHALGEAYLGLCQAHVQCVRREQGGHDAGVDALTQIRTQTRDQRHPPFPFLHLLINLPKLNKNLFSAELSLRFSTVLVDKQLKLLLCVDE